MLIIELLKVLLKNKRNCKIFLNGNIEKFYEIYKKFSVKI